MYQGGLVARQTTAECAISSPKPLGVLEQLQVRKQEITDQLETINKAIDLFTKTPEMEQALTCLSRIGIYR